MRVNAVHAGIEIDKPGIEIINARLRAATPSMPTISMTGCSARASSSATASA